MRSASAATSPGGCRPCVGHELGQPAGARRDDRQPGRHRLERGEREDLLVARRHERERGAGAQPGELGRRRRGR